MSTASWISLDENVPTDLLKFCNVWMVCQQSHTVAFSGPLDFWGNFRLHPLKLPASCAGREWSWNIGDNDGKFLQYPILFHDVNSKGKLTISDQYLSQGCLQYLSPLVAILSSLLFFLYFPPENKVEVDIQSEIQRRYSVTNPWLLAPVSS